MTAQARLAAQKAESGLTGREQKDHSKKKKTNQTDGTSHFAQSAGNNAITQVLADSQSGTPLQNDFREQMERRLGVSLAGVRIRDDAAAHESAEAMDAEAYTRGDEIVMGSNAPSMGDPGSEDFLAHELVHVVQQRNASAIRPGVSAPGDQFEREAEGIANQAHMGQSVSINAGGPVPAVQRQPVGTLKMRVENPRASRAEVEQAILAYLQRAQAAQEGNKLQLTEPVKTAMRMLATTSAPGGAADTGGVQRNINMENLIGGTTADEADLAKRAAQILPDPFDRAALKKLETMAVADAPKGLIDRAKESAERNLKTPDNPNKDLIPDPKKRMDEEMDKMRAARGGPQAHGFGPVAVDPFAIGRVIRDITAKPKTPARNVQARDYPEVEQAIQKIAAGALMPPEAKGKSNEGEFVDQAQDVARRLAADLDIAQQKNQDTVELRLPPAYHRSQSREAMINAVESIVQSIRQALPHHASNVRNVDLFFGDFKARRITTGSGE